MTSKEVDAAVREQIASAADANFLALGSHRTNDRRKLDRLRRDIERKRGEALLTPHEVKAVRSGRMNVGHVTLEPAGAESVNDYLAMSEEHERRRRGAL